MNRASSTPPATKAAATDPAPHPFDGASMTAQSSAVSPAIDKTAPTGSRRGRAGSLDSGTSRYPRTSPMRRIGMFTMKIEPHQKCSSKKPPVIGPRPIPSADRSEEHTSELQSLMRNSYDVL